MRRRVDWGCCRRHQAASLVQRLLNMRLLEVEVVDA